MEENQREETEVVADGWVFVAGGVLAMLVTPYLVEIAPHAGEFLLATAFGALVGACDASRARDMTEAVLRTGWGIIVGLLVGASLMFSVLLAGVVLGVGVVASRWAWFEGEEKCVSRELGAAVIAASGMWLVPPGTVFSFVGDVGQYFPAVVWGFCSGLAVMLLMLSDDDSVQAHGGDIEESVEPKLEQKPEPGGVDGTVTGEVVRLSSTRGAR